MKKCPFCAEEIQDEAVVCRFCGRELDEAPAQPEPDASEHVSPLTRPVSPLTAVAVFILAAIIFGWLVTSDACSGSGDHYQESTPRVQQPASTADAPFPEAANALRAAENYLLLMPFSQLGLQEQLSSQAGDGYSAAAAKWAVDHVEVDWKEQAVLAAKNYLELMPFSTDGLRQQLTSGAGDKYTAQEAGHAIRVLQAEGLL